MNCTYKIVNTKNGKYYYGSSKDHKARFRRHKYELKYNKHHCIHLQRAYNKYGKDSFKFEIDLEFNTMSEAVEFEDNFIKKNYSKLYNTSKHASGGDLISNHPNRNEIILKMKKSLKDRYINLSSEERRNIYGKNGERNGMFGKKHSIESKKKISKKLKGNACIWKGRSLLDSAKKKLSKIAKQRVGEKNPFFGKHHSKETKDKLSKIHKGRIPSNARKVVSNNKIYKSLAECARDNNISNALVIYRIKKGVYKYYEEGAETSS